MVPNFSQKLNIFRNPLNRIRGKRRYKITTFSAQNHAYLFFTLFIPLVYQIHYHLHHHILLLSLALCYHQSQGYEGVVGKTL